MSLKQSWQESLSNLITDPAELFTMLELDPAFLKGASQATQLFPLKVTREFVARMQKGDIHDPLLRQILPLENELENVPGYDCDPLREANVNPVPGLLHKYESRVLVTLTAACAVNCRFCFRRHFPYEENNPGRRGWEKMIDYLNAHPKINEVILSGGDPLSVSDSLLFSFTEQLFHARHVKKLRIHTRLPTALPARITDALVDWIKQLKWALVIVVHINHPNEINAEVKSALKKLRESGATLLNQSVLLRGVNDDAATLVALSESLFTAGVLPYYLHVLDKVSGVAHFDLPLANATTLHTEMAKQLPGYLVPKLVREEAGQPSKTLLNF